MTQYRRFVAGVGFVFLACAIASAQQPTAAQTDVYHVHFTKAVPGQAVQLGDFLKTEDPKAPMPGHFVVLRHQQGDDWDYCVIEHRGAKATIDAAPTAPNPGRDMRSWHTDTFVSGPSWADFTKAMGIGDASSSTGGSVYTLAVWRAAAGPGHREQLEKALQAPAGAKGPAGSVLLTHLEGGPWQYVAISRYNSWQDFATDQAGSTGDAAWGEIRQHGSYHHDTVADRLAPR
jgi:hypothetical protein